MNKKTIGIIGGMGPLATADLFRKIVTHTQATCDQDHLHVIIDNNTAIPDRTAALLRGGEDPLPQMKKSARMLESDGADCLIMPCNTAHFFHAQVQSSVHIPLLNMLELTCQEMQRRGIRTAGLLATNGTVLTGVCRCGRKIWHYPAHPGRRGPAGRYGYDLSRRKGRCRRL